MDFIEYSQQYLRRFSCNKLKDLCKEKRIKGYTKYQKKQNLIDYIIKVKNNEDENKNRLYFQKQQLIHFYKKVKRINYKKYWKLNFKSKKMKLYKLTKKYNELDDDIIFPRTSKFEKWLLDTPKEFKLLAAFVGCIDANLMDIRVQDVEKQTKEKYRDTPI